MCCVAQLQTIFPGQKSASGRGGLGFVCILGDPVPGGELPSIQKCLLCRSCQNTPQRNTWDALRAGGAQKRQSHIRTVFPGHELLTAEKKNSL